MSAPDALLFLGDSITEQWAVQRAAFFADNAFVNRGLGGEATGHVRARFAQEIAHARPALVHLMCGINDIGEIHGPYVPEDTKANLAAMIDAAQDLRCPLLIGSLLPAWFNWRPDVRPAGMIEALNDWLRAYATAHGAHYVDYHRALRGPDGRLKPPYALDGLHLTAQGYARMEPILAEAVRRLCPERPVRVAPRSGRTNLGAWLRGLFGQETA